MPWRLISIAALIGSLYCFFNEQLSILATSDEPLIPVTRGPLMGYITPKGREALPFTFDSASAFDNKGMAKVKLNTKSGWIDPKGKTVISCQWDKAEDFDNCDMAQVTKDDNVGWIDRSGKLVIPPQWDKVEDFDNIGMAQVMKQGKVGWIDRSGTVVIPPRWHRAGQFDSKNMVAIEDNNKKTGWIDRTGKVIIEPQWDTLLSSFDNQDMAPVAKNDHYGWIDRTGKIVLPLQWDYVDSFDCKGMALVRKGEKFGCIDRTGKVVIPIEWTSGSFFDATNLAKVFKDGVKQWIDRNGKIVSPPKFIDKKPVDSNHLVEVLAESDPMFALVTQSHVRTFWKDTDGQLWDEIYSPYLDENGVRIVSLNFLPPGAIVYDYEYGCINRDGKFIIPRKPRLHVHRERVIVSSPSQKAKTQTYYVSNLDENTVRKPGIWDWLCSKLPFLTRLKNQSDETHFCTVYDPTGRIIWRSDWRDRDRLWGIGLAVLAVGAFFANRRKKMKAKDGNDAPTGG